jgi:hypothetical protein
METQAVRLFSLESSEFSCFSHVRPLAFGNPTAVPVRIRIASDTMPFSSFQLNFPCRARATVASGRSLFQRSAEEGERRRSPLISECECGGTGERELGTRRFPAGACRSTGEAGEWPLASMRLLLEATGEFKTGRWARVASLIF